MYIIQPRIDNYSSWKISVSELLDYGRKIKPIAELAFEGKGEYKYGKHCRFCKAKNICPLYKSKQPISVSERTKKGTVLKLNI